MRISDNYILKIPAACASQIGRKKYHLGTYDEEADAARAFDRVASALGRPLNFPEEDESEIIGPRSEGADQAVAEAVKAAETFMGASDKAKNAKRAAETAKKGAEVHSQTLTALHALKTSNPATLTILKQMGPSEYKGIYPNKNTWWSQIKVSPRQ